MKVLDSILGNLLAESEAARRRALATSGEVRPENRRVRRAQARSLQGRHALRLRSLLEKVRDKSQRLVSGAADAVFDSTEEAEVTSSRPSIATAEVVGGTPRARRSRFEVKVTQLAREQVNEGQSLSDSSTTSIQSGTNTFTITVGSQPATTVSVDITQGESNISSLEKIEEAINDADAGVTAEVVSDSDAGTSYLRLKADETGTEKGFSLADTSGNVVSTTGIDTTDTAAQDARYVLNGQAFTSSSNTVVVDDGRVKITLNGVSGPEGSYKEAAAILEIGPDPVPAVILGLADGFNRLRDFLKGSGTEGSRSLLHTVDELAVKHESELRSVGVKRDTGGDLQVDRFALEEQLGSSPAQVEEALGGTEGFATELYSATSSLLADTTSDLAAREGQLVSYGFAVQGGFLGTNFVFGRGAQVNLMV